MRVLTIDEMHLVAGGKPAGSTSSSKSSMSGTKSTGTGGQAGKVNRDGTKDAANKSFGQRVGDAAKHIGSYTSVSIGLTGPSVTVGGCGSCHDPFGGKRKP